MSKSKQAEKAKAEAAAAEQAAAELKAKEEAAAAEKAKAEADSEDSDPEPVEYAVTVRNQYSNSITLRTGQTIPAGGSLGLDDLEGLDGTAHFDACVKSGDLVVE